MLNKVSFIAQFEKIEISSVSIVDLHANFFDLFYLKQLEKKRLVYGVTSVFWILSKVSIFGNYSKKPSKVKVNLLVPSEPEKERSIGMFNPVHDQFQNEETEIVPLRNLFSKVGLRLFLKRFIQLPNTLLQVHKALSKAIQIDIGIKQYYLQFFIDSLIHLVLIDHLKLKLTNYHSVLVDWDRQKLASLVIVSANFKQLNTFTFIHGAIYTPEKFVPLIAKFCFAWSNSQKEYLCSLGVKRESIFVTGNPRFKKDLPRTDSLCKKYGLEGKKIILYPSQNFPDFKSEELIELILRGLKNRSDWRLIVKRHPSEKEEAFKKYQDTYSDAIFLDKTVEVDESLGLCDFVFLVSSTFSIDSLIKRKPILLFNPWEESKGIARNLVNYGATSIDTLEKFNNIMDSLANGSHDLESILNQKGLQEFFNSYCTYTGQESAVRIREVLNNMD